MYDQAAIAIGQPKNIVEAQTPKCKLVNRDAEICRSARSERSWRASFSLLSTVSTASSSFVCRNWI
eukprot:4800292-Prymnesium_polylepis.3